MNDTVDKKTRSKIMASIRSRGNKSTELTMRMILVRNKISGWNLQPEGIIGNPDFIFPDIQLAIFVDGCFWHGCPKCGHLPLSNTKYWHSKLHRNIARDKQLRSKLRRKGWSVLRVWEHELLKPNKVFYRINGAIKRRKAIPQTALPQ